MANKYGLDSLGATIVLIGETFFRVKGDVAIKEGIILIDGKVEEVTFYPGTGWLSAAERWNLQQTDPRMAP